MNRRLASRKKLDIVGRKNREVRFWNRNHPADVAVDNRYRTTPKALPTHEPIAQSEVDGSRSDRLRFEEGNCSSDCFLFAHSVEELAIDMESVAGECFALKITRGFDCPNDGKSVCLSEIPIALVFGRYGHDGACAVSHKDVVREIERYRFLCEWITHIRAGEDSALVERTFRRHALDVAGLSGACNERSDLVTAFSGHHNVDEWVLRGHHRIGHPETRVGASGEDIDSYT